MNKITFSIEEYELIIDTLKRAAFRLHKIKISGISDESLTLPIVEKTIAYLEEKLK